MAELKPRRTRREMTADRIEAVALSLFIKHGFDAVTVEDIATAAGISRRTFFYHFASKEDVVFCFQEERAKQLLQFLAERPAEESVMDAALRSVLQYAASTPLGGEGLVALIHSTPQLQTRNTQRNADVERQLAQALMDRAGPDEDPFEIELIAMVMLGAGRVSATRWLASTRTVSSAHAFLETLDQFADVVARMRTRLADAKAFIDS